MAVAFEIFVGDLLAKFLADTFGIFGRFHAAGAIAATAFQTLFDDFDNFFVFIEADFHGCDRSFRLAKASFLAELGLVLRSKIATDSMRWRKPQNAFERVIFQTNTTFLSLPFYFTPK